MNRLCPATPYVPPRAVSATQDAVTSIAQCCAASVRCEAAGALAALSPIKRAFVVRLAAIRP